jgi:hypothetical protein
LGALLLALRLDTCSFSPVLFSDKDLVTQLCWDYIDWDLSVARGRKVASYSFKLSSQLVMVANSPLFITQRWLTSVMGWSPKRESRWSQGGDAEDNPLVIGSPYPLPVWSAVDAEIH